MAEKIQEYMLTPFSEELRLLQIQRLSGKYDWKTIAEKTAEVYHEVIGKGRNHPSDNGFQGQRRSL